MVGWTARQQTARDGGLNGLLEPSGHRSTAPSIHSLGVVFMCIHVCMQVCEPMGACSEGRILGVTHCSLPLFPSHKGLSLNLEITIFAWTSGQ